MWHERKMIHGTAQRKSISIPRQRLRADFMPSPVINCRPYRVAVIRTRSPERDRIVMVKSGTNRLGFGTVPGNGTAKAESR